MRRAGQHRLQARGQLLPARIESLGAGQRVQPPLLDAMHQLARLARGGHKVVPAPRDVRFRVEAQNAPGDGVAMMVVVEEPAVEAGLAQRRLNRVKVHTRFYAQSGGWPPAGASATESCSEALTVDSKAPANRLGIPLNLTAPPAPPLGRGTARRIW